MRYIYIPVWLCYRLISTGLELVLSHTEKSGIASYYRQFSTNMKIKIIKSIPVLLAPFFHVDICRKLSLLQHDK